MVWRFVRSEEAILENGPKMFLVGNCCLNQIGLMRVMYVLCMST